MLLVSIAKLIISTVCHVLSVMSVQQALKNRLSVLLENMRASSSLVAQHARLNIGLTKAKNIAPLYRLE